MSVRRLVRACRSAQTHTALHVVSWRNTAQRAPGDPLAEWATHLLSDECSCGWRVVVGARSKEPISSPRRAPHRRDLPQQRAGRSASQSTSVPKHQRPRAGFEKRHFG